MTKENRFTDSQLKVFDLIVRHFLA
jgi:DNA topoisomerase-3